MSTVLFFSSATWTAPPGVVSVKAECWGGGGGGGEGQVGYGGGGGGGGGYGTRTVDVTPGDNYAVTVGGGGNGNISPSSGGDSSFSGDAAGASGYGGTAGSSLNPGTGGTGSGSTTYAGGDGVMGKTTGAGEGGGGAGSGGNGSPGTGGTPDGGGPKLRPGGGGSGGEKPDGYGAAGAPGMVRLTYTPAYPDELVGKGYANSAATSVTVQATKPSGGNLVPADDDILVAVVTAFRATNAAPGNISWPAGWTQWGSRTTSYRLMAWGWKRASEESTGSYQFGSADATVMAAQLSVWTQAKASGDPLAKSSNTAYTTDDAVVRAASVTTTAAKPILWAGYNDSTSAAGNFGTVPKADMLHIDNARRLKLATGWFKQGAAGATGDIDGQIGHNSQIKHAVMLQLLFPTAPGRPTVTAPFDGSSHALDSSVALKAISVDPGNKNITYRWQYSDDGGGTWTTIGTSDEAASGAIATLDWDTAGLDTGTYRLRVKAINTDDGISAYSAVVSVVLAYVVIVEPEAGAVLGTGALNLRGHGYLPSAGRVWVEWEIDKNEPPDDQSVSYQTTTSGRYQQGDLTEIPIAIDEPGIYYLRARALSEADEATAWTPTRHIYVYESLRAETGCEVSVDRSQCYNRVYVRTQDGTASGVATHDTPGTAFRYSDTPRETVITIPTGTSGTCTAAAESKLAQLLAPAIQITGLSIRLADGLKLRVGCRVGLSIPRAAINGIYVIRALEYDVGRARCEVTLGEALPKSRWDALATIAQRLMALERN